MHMHIPVHTCSVHCFAHNMFMSHLLTGQLAVLDYLINELGVDPVAREKSGISTVHAAVQAGQYKAVKVYISRNDTVLDQYATLWRIIFFLLWWYIHDLWSQWLISKLGSKYILDKTIDGATPLHMAAGLYMCLSATYVSVSVCECMHVNTCEWMYICVSTHMWVWIWQCAIMKAVSIVITAQGNTDILRYLLENLENKSDVNVLDHIHATPAHDAAEYGQMQSMLLLLKNGADIAIKDTVRIAF